MINCEFCGATNKESNKFCEYCGKEINSLGQDHPNGGDAVLVLGTFKMFGKGMVIGKPLQKIKVGDYLYLRDRSYKVVSLEYFKKVVNSVGPDATQVGIAFENYDIAGINKGEVLSFSND